MNAPAGLNPEQAIDKPPRTKRWIPLSLRMFVAMTALLGVGSATWVGIPVYQQLVAIREIKGLGGRVYAEHGGPDWLRDWLGDEAMQGFDDVEEVSFYKTKINDQRLRCCRRLTNLKRVDVLNTSVTDAGVADLQRALPELWINK